MYYNHYIFLNSYLCFISFGRRVNSSGYNSSAAVFTWRYQVVNAIPETCADPSILTDSNSLKEEELIKPKSVTTKEIDSEKVDKDMESSSSAENIIQSSVRYEFSPPCNIIMVPKDTGLQVFCE